MARTTRPDSIYRVSLHRNGGHQYAATHPYVTGPEGKRRYSVMHWGIVTEDLRFIPGKRYLEAGAEERAKLIFPEEWDLSAAAGPSVPKGFPFRFVEGDAGKAFGDVWLLESIVGRFGVREDLAEALGDTCTADDLLTLTYFPLLTGTSFVRFARWQSSSKVPSGRSLGEMLSKSLASVDSAKLRRFMDLRLERFASDRLCAVDSVSRFSFGSTMPDRRWGQKAERIHYRSAVEAVAYSLDADVPVVYTSFPEAVTDARGIGIFREELKKVGMEGITVVTDRGYDSLQGLERYYGDGPMVMCLDVKQPLVMEIIQGFGEFRGHPAGMRYDAASRRWYRQFRLDGPGASSSSDPAASGPDLRLNLFFNPGRREAELAQIDSEILSQQSALQEIVDYGITIDDRRSLRYDYYFFNVAYDAENKLVTSFSPARGTILNTRAACGFYANATVGLDVGPLEAVGIYGLKYDQEKFLRQFRSLLDFRLGPSGAGLSGIPLHGIQLMMYIGLLLHTHITHSLRSRTSRPSDAAIPFRTVTELLDELHSVTCVPAPDGSCALSPLTPLQQRLIEL